MVDKRRPSLSSSSERTARAKAEPSERDRPLDWHFLFVGWVLNREQWWDPSLLLRLFSGAQQGRLLEAEGQEQVDCNSPGQEEDTLEGKNTIGNLTLVDYPPWVRLLGPQGPPASGIMSQRRPGTGCQITWILSPALGFHGCVDSGQITELSWVSLCSCRRDRMPSNLLTLQDDLQGGTGKAEWCPWVRW